MDRFHRTIAELWVYPLKGARGISLTRATVRRAGLLHDRRFMLVTPDGTFMTQRSHARLALVEVELRDDSIVIGAPEHGSAVVSLTPEGPRRRVVVWNDVVEAVDVRGQAAKILSSFLGEECGLVHMPPDVIRRVDAKYATPTDHVGFADDFPLLLATKASLDDLNAKLASPIPMNRFRPNVVVAGGDPFEEDRHRAARIGNIPCRMPKRCARCVVTTIDQSTAIAGVEPLRTLAKYRGEDSNVYFAQNLVPDGEGDLSVGDPVEYLDAVS